MSTEDDEPDGFFYWSGPLNARKIVERVIAGIIVGLAMGAGFFLSTVIGGLF